MRPIEAMKKGQIKIISMNINGLNSDQKRKRTFAQLKKLQADIICLQETHMRRGDQHLCKRLGKVFAASDHTKKKRDLAIYAKEHLNPNQIFASEDGRIQMIAIQRRTKMTLIMNIYAPNEKQEPFFIRLHQKLQELEYQEICVIGDYNSVYDRIQDRKTTSKRKNTGNLLPKPFLHLAEELELVDAWRTRNPATRDFTFYSQRHLSWLRIDMCWVTLDMMKNVENVDILPGTFADHNPILLTIKDLPKKTLWRLNTMLLKNKKFEEEVKKEMTDFLKYNTTADASIWKASKAFFRGLAIRFKEPRGTGG